MYVLAVGRVKQKTSFNYKYALECLQIRQTLVTMLVTTTSGTESNDSVWLVQPPRYTTVYNKFKSGHWSMSWVHDSKAHWIYWLSSIQHLKPLAAGHTHRPAARQSTNSSHAKNRRCSSSFVDLTDPEEQSRVRRTITNLEKVHNAATLNPTFTVSQRKSPGKIHLSLQGHTCIVRVSSTVCIPMDVKCTLFLRRVSSWTPGIFRSGRYRWYLWDTREVLLWYICNTR